MRTRAACRTEGSGIALSVTMCRLQRCVTLGVTATFRGDAVFSSQPRRHRERSSACFWGCGVEEPPASEAEETPITAITCPMI
jgi:hypothetical protein